MNARELLWHTVKLAVVSCIAYVVLVVFQNDLLEFFFICDTVNEHFPGSYTDINRSLLCQHKFGLILPMYFSPVASLVDLLLIVCVGVALGCFVIFAGRILGRGIDQATGILGQLILVFHFGTFIALVFARTTLFSGFIAPQGTIAEYIKKVEIKNSEGCHRVTLGVPPFSSLCSAITDRIRAQVNFGNVERKDNLFMRDGQIVTPTEEELESVVKRLQEQGVLPEKGLR